MGDFSAVDLWLAPEHKQLVHDVVKKWGGAPDEMLEPSLRDPLGRPDGDLWMCWHELRAGIDNDMINELCQELRDRGIDYRMTDGGCWGSWPEEEEIHLDGNTGRRPLSEAQPVLGEATFLSVSRSLDGDELLEWVRGYFTPDPSRWVW